VNPFSLAQIGLSKLGVADWHLMAFICIAFAAIGYFLLQYGLLRSKTWSLIGGVLMAAALLIAGVSQNLDFEKVVLFTFCGLSISGGTAFLVARQPVHAALGFATAILSGAGVLFMQSAHFVAAATIIVYAGATIIIFLFVLMFSQLTSLETYELKLNRPFLAAIAGGILLGVLVYALQSMETGQVDIAKSSVSRPLSQETKSSVPDSTAGLGRSMFTDYLFTVELAGTLLLAATIGAIAVAQRTLEVQA
jgi:NADH-quinone oxidoreductase subunit J